ILALAGTKDLYTRQDGLKVGLTQPLTGSQSRLAMALALLDSHPESVKEAAAHAQKAFREGPDRALTDALTMLALKHPGEFLTHPAWWLEGQPLTPPEYLRAVELSAGALGATGTAKQLDALLTSLDGNHPDYIATIVKGLAAGWPARKTVTLSPEAEKAVLVLLPKLPAASRGRLLKLGATWGVKGLDEQLAEITKAAFATL